MDEYIANFSKAKVGADGRAVSAISQFGKNFGRGSSPFDVGGEGPFKLGKYSFGHNKQMSDIFGFDKNLLDILKQYGIGGV